MTTSLLDTLGVTVPSTVPTHWYNLAADLPSPCPPALHPGTREPLDARRPGAAVPDGADHAGGQHRAWIEIPEPVREIYALWRPSPLIRARRLERALGTPAHIYYKYEGVSPVGSHKPNTAVAQAYYNAAEGITKLTTETGAGQWGASLAMACALLGLTCEVWQVRASFDAKPYRRMQMETYGSICHPSPSDLTNAGRAMLAADPGTTGSLGMAISEAVEAAATDPDAHYSLGSVLNHVLLHQSVIGQEALAQLDTIEETATWSSRAPGAVRTSAGSPSRSWAATSGTAPPPASSPASRRRARR